MCDLERPTCNVIDNVYAVSRFFFVNKSLSIFLRFLNSNGIIANFLISERSNKTAIIISKL